MLNRLALLRLLMATVLAILGSSLRPVQASPDHVYSGKLCDLQNTVPVTKGCNLTPVCTVAPVMGLGTRWDAEWTAGISQTLNPCKGGTAGQNCCTNDVPVCKHKKWTDVPATFNCTTATSQPEITYDTEEDCDTMDPPYASYHCD